MPSDTVFTFSQWDHLQYGRHWSFVQKRRKPGALYEIFKRRAFVFRTRMSKTGSFCFYATAEIDGGQHLPADRTFILASGTWKPYNRSRQEAAGGG